MTDPSPGPAPLVTAAWWRVFVERLARTAGQAAIPYLAAVQASGGTIDLAAVALGLAGAVAATVLSTAIRGLADVTVAPDAVWWAQLIDRGVPAAAAVLAGLQLASWSDITAVDWAQTGQQALVAAVLALLTYYVAPPAFAHRARLVLGGGR